MRKKTARICILLSTLVLSALYSASINIQPAAALPIKEFQTEYTFLNTTIWNQIPAANQTSQKVETLAQSLFGTAFLTGPGIKQWNNTILQLESQLSALNALYKLLPNNMFAMDILLRKYDVTLQIAINASVIADSVQSQ